MKKSRSDVLFWIAVTSSLFFSAFAIYTSWFNLVPTISTSNPSPSCAPASSSSPDSVLPSVPSSDTNSDSTENVSPSPETNSLSGAKPGPSGPAGPAGQTGPIGPAGECSSVPLTSLSSDLVPSLDNFFNLGSSVFRWKSLQLGPGTLYMEDIMTGLQAAMTVSAGTFLLDGVESLTLGNIQITENGIRSVISTRDIKIGETGDLGYLAPARGIKFSDGTTQTTATLVGPQGLQGPQGIQGTQGPQGIQGIQGPQGGFGYFGSFYDTSSHTLTSSTATSIPLNTTVFNNGVSIVDSNKITFANAGKYNIAFSVQIYNSANQRRIVSIWLSKNGITSDKWMPESATDIYIGTAVDTERKVAAWNFFVDAAANDYYVLMVAADGANVSLYGDTSGVTSPANIPAIPSTILTVNQVG